MSITLRQLEAEALELPADQRIDLAQRLFASIDDEDVLEDPGIVEQAWLEEAERRYERHLAGGTDAVPATEAIARVRNRLNTL